ncbi:hypothetical protein C0Z18_01385 [Trinickia dabaoshanensis]|uniref:Uncharacterized protein n=1 Tax=Trinickia dabaoshanensis TaxID=564714 RepID=A0A2N7W3K0_9BURK|nr:hypothetical protein [Trinickia dabaoshanensis]PMS23978.1 hypothetical protein C0Z18_01385 [Trinickia dabaoshanensis]
MRTTRSGDFSQYWPVALAIALIVLAVLRAYGGAGAAREPLAADQVTAELARTVSYGLIDAGVPQTASSVRQGVAPAAAQQAS